MHKKVLALLMVVVMVCSFTTSAFASEPLTALPILTEQMQGAHLHDEAPPVEEKQTVEKVPEKLPVATGETTAPPAEDNAPIQPPAESQPEELPPVLDSGIPPGFSEVEPLPLPETPTENPEMVSCAVDPCKSDGTYIGSGVRPRLVGSRICNTWKCTNIVIVTNKYDKFCYVHKCKIAGCQNIIRWSNGSLCQQHLGMPPVCQISTGNDGNTICGQPASGPYTCYAHWCQSCNGNKNPSDVKCYYCYQCWVIGCPNNSTCGNECDAHCPHNCKIHHQTHCLNCHGAGNCCVCNTCPHTCKTHHLNHCTTCHGAGNCCACNTCAHTCKAHHQNHCTTCHISPCICYPLSPIISVGGWNSGDNSVTVSISSTRATQIEVYSSANQLVTGIGGASGSYVFRYNAAHNNGGYYVRVKNASGYNPTCFPFSVSTLDRTAPNTHTVSLSPSGWASSKTLTVTADDQTNARFALQYANGTTVPYCVGKEGAAAGGKFTASWEITEQIISAKDFRLVTTDCWGYSSSYDFTVNQIDTVKPSRPTIAKSTEKEWHNGVVSLAIDGGFAPSGIAGYEYRVNGGGWQNGDSFSLSAQGEYTVEARVISNAGLASDSASAVVKIDTTKPSGTFTLSHDAEKWTTDAVTIRFTPSDTGGSEIFGVNLPNGQAAARADDISYTVSQNGSYAFTVTDNAGNVNTIIVPVEFIAMLDVTVTLNTPFVILPDEDKVYGGNIRFANHSNVPVRISMERMEPQNGAPSIVPPDSKDWKSLSVKDTQRYVALGFIGNSRDCWLGDSPQALGTVTKNSTASFSMKAKHGYAWENPQSLLYAMTVKVAIDQ